MTTIGVQLQAIIMASPDRADRVFFFQDGGGKPERAHARCTRKARRAGADDDRIRIIRVAL